MKKNYLYFLIFVAVFSIFLFFYFSDDGFRLRINIFSKEEFVGDVDIKNRADSSGGRKMKPVGSAVKNDNSADVIFDTKCESDPQGFTYFRLGDEIFRYKDDSPIRIHKAILASAGEHKKEAGSYGIREGCAGNPYVNFWLVYSYGSDDDEYKKINLKKISVIEVARERRSVVSPGQILHEDSYGRFKVNKKPCEYIDVDLERCVWPYDDQEKFWSRVYRVSGHQSLGRPFYMDCIRFVGDIECGTYYRLYDSFNFTYSFYLSENKGWADRDLVRFDRYLRNVFESMRIVDVN